MTNSRRRRTMLGGTLLLGAVLAIAPLPVSADGGHGPACGEGTDPWHDPYADAAPIGEAECHFLFRGTPVNVVATAKDPEGAGRSMTVRVWVHEHTDHDRLGPLLGHETTLLMECTGEGNGEATCTGNWPIDDQVDLIHPVLTQQVYLSCHIEASIEGTTTLPVATYGCKSGRGF